MSHRQGGLLTECRADLKQFFEHLPDLLAGPESRFSFFNGLGATSKHASPHAHTGISDSSADALFYDVYTRVSDLHLADVGIDVAWSDVDVFEGGGADRWGETREYFGQRFYRLPLGRMRAIA